MTLLRRIGLKRLTLVVLLPLAAFALQSIFWAAIRPFAWFLFFPAVFFSSWIGGLSGGVIATLISTALAWWAFIPQEYSFALEDPVALASIGLFLGMGFLFGYTQERITKANLRTAEALAVARSANEQLQDANEKIEAANSELEAFSYSVSHDLRAPLRAMDGFSKILLERYAEGLAPEGQRYLGIVRDSSREMGVMVDELLNFSRLGRQELERRPVAPADVARAALGELTADGSGGHLEVRIDELPACRADPGLLKLVFVNLLGNALKFSRDRDPAIIEVTARDGEGAGDGPVYVVRDNGVGFDMRYADKLFGVFQRLHRAEEFEGTGVGLAIVARIVERHGGRIWAESAPGAGATFLFTLGGKP